jgi:hypothetical protein
MSRSFGIVDAKVAEANFFLKSMKEVGSNFFKVRCYFSAFISSSRSITYAIQASIGDLPGFDDWYIKQQEALRSNQLARFFHDARIADHHIGINLVSGGEVTSELGSPHILHYFAKTESDTPSPDTDVVTACQQYLTALIAIVYACYIQFGDYINPDQYYNEEVFASHGFTVEDAEEEVFGFRGWTAATDVNISERWQMIRESVAPCNINHIFQEYLGQELPKKPDG